jgi:hypothetical protein
MRLVFHWAKAPQSCDRSSRQLRSCARRAGQSTTSGSSVWQREGLKVPHKQPKRGRLWLADGSCIRLRPEHPHHVFYDFVEDRTHDGRKYRMLNTCSTSSAMNAWRSRYTAEAIARRREIAELARAMKALARNH